jgi:His/Glu/Gln/Arg/opine family amino acid ABC transporter permease subunit
MGISEILNEYGKGFLNGMKVTVELAGLVWTFGIVLGVALAALQKRFPRLVGWPGKAASFVITSVPVIVLLFWFHYPMQTLLGIQLNPFVTAVFTLSLVNVLAVTDIVRPALVSFPSGYTAAAQVAGLRPRQIFRRIQMPLNFRQVTPALLGLQVMMLQATIFASLISVNEIFRVAERVNSRIYRPVQVYSALAVFFLMMCLPLNGITRALERKFRPKLSIE